MITIHRHLVDFDKLESFFQTASLILFHEIKNVFQIFESSVFFFFFNNSDGKHHQQQQHHHKSIKNLCIFRNLCMKYHVIVRSYIQTSRDFSSVCHFDPQNIYIPFSLDEIRLEFYELDSSSMLEDFCLQHPSVSIVVKQGTCILHE